MNVCGAIPGVLDKACLGHPGKYSYCIAEDEEATRWDPLHVDRGLPRELSAVTVMAAEAPHYVRNAFGTGPEEILTSVADVMAHGSYAQGAYLVVLSPEHRAIVEGALVGNFDPDYYRSDRKDQKIDAVTIVSGGSANQAALERAAMKRASSESRRTLCVFWRTNPRTV